MFGLSSMKIPRFQFFHKFRMIVCFVVWFDLLATYMCRINLSVGIIGISRYLKTSSNITLGEGMQNYLLLAFNMGYLLLHIPGAICCIIFGSRIVTLWSLFLTSVFTFLCVPATYLHPWALFGMRIIVGASGATIIPIVQQCVANHAMPNERTFYFLAIMTGNVASLIIMFPIGGYLIENYTKGWEYIFYLTGTICGIAFVLHYFFSFEDPDQNPWMSKEEQTQIVNAIYPEGKPLKKTLFNYPFGDILKSSATYVFMFVHFGKLLIFNMNLFGLVKYFRSYYALSIINSSNLAIIPFTLDFLFHFIYHHVVDIMKKAGWTMTRIRRVNTFIGTLWCSSFLLGLAFVPSTQAVLGVIISSCGMILIPAFQSGYFPAIIEYAPQYSLVTMAIINVAGSFSGVLQRFMTGMFIEQAPSLYIGYRNTFIFTSILSFATSMVYVLFGTAERQPWSLSHTVSKKEIPSADAVRDADAVTRV